MNAIDCIKHHGISPSTLNYRMINDWTLGPVRECLDQYYLLYWAPEYFFSELKEGTLQRDDTKYLVVYHDCTPAILKRYSQIAISFRKPNPDLPLPAYAVVSVRKIQGVTQ